MPSAAGALGGTLLYFLGTGFAFGNGRGAVEYRYISNFGDFQSPQMCKALNMSVVICGSPLWPFAGTDALDVTLSRTSIETPEQAEQHRRWPVQGSVSMMIYSEVSSFAPSSGGALSGTNISIFGRGFGLLSRKYFCRWSVSLKPFIPRLQIEAVVVNTSVVTCEIQRRPPSTDIAREGCACGLCDSCVTNHANVSAEKTSCLQFLARFCNGSIANSSQEYWEFPSSASTFSLLEAKITGDSVVPFPHIADFETFVQVRRCEPTSSGAGVSHMITVFGAGFTPFREYPTYYCSLSDGVKGEVQQSALAHADDVTRVVCNMPPYLSATRVNITLYQLNPELQSTGNRHDSTEIPHETLQTLTYRYYPRLLSIQPSRAPAISGAAVNISVIGVVTTSDLVVRFSREDGEQVLYADSTVTMASGSLLSLNAPIWDSEWGAGVVNVTLVWGGEVLASAARLHFEYDETLSSIMTQTGKASGGFLFLTGYAWIKQEPVYYCTISSVANSSHSSRGPLSFSESSSTLTCSYDVWPYPAGLVYVRLWRGEQEIARLEVSRPLIFTMQSVWWGRLLERQLDWWGGKLVTIDGFGIKASPNNSTPTFKCTWQSMTELDATGEARYSVSTAGFAVSPTLMYCVSPLWLGKDQDSQLHIYECEIPASYSPILNVGLPCERLLQRIGPWYGTISFAAGPMIMLQHTTPNAPIRGGDSTITLSGRNFADRDMSPIGRVGDSVCEFTRWVSESSILCGVSPMGTPILGMGVPMGCDFVVGFLGITKMGSRSLAFSYDGPEVRDLGRDFGQLCAGWKVGNANCSQLGLGGKKHQQQPFSMTQMGNLALFTSSKLNLTRRLYFSGKDMAVADVTLRARVGGSVCEETLWVSSSWVLCKHAMGFGASRAGGVVTVQYSQRLGTSTAAFSMDKIDVSGIINGIGVHGISVMIHSEGFGFVCSTHHARLDGSACSSTRWQSSTSLLCRSAAGIASSHRVSVSAGVLASSLTEAMSFDLSMSAMSRQNSPVTGCTSVTLHGLGFGHRALSANERVAHTRSEASDWTSDTSTRCLVAKGLSATRRVSLTVGTRDASLTSSFSFAAVKVVNAALGVDLGVQTALPVVEFDCTKLEPWGRGEPECGGTDMLQLSNLQQQTYLRDIAGRRDIAGGFGKDGSYQVRVAHTSEGFQFPEYQRPGLPEVAALFEGMCLTPNPKPLKTSWREDIGPACTNFSEWEVHDGALNPEITTSLSSWYFCSDVDSATYCKELMELEARNKLRTGSLVSRAVRQAGFIYSDYSGEKVEGTTLVYNAAASYSTQ